MAQGKKEAGLKRYSLRLYEADVSALESYYAGLSVTEAIRSIVHKHVNKLHKARRSLNDGISGTDSNPSPDLGGDL